MKILLDMNVPPLWEDYLNAQGHEAAHWSEIGNIRATDTEIMDWARRNRHIVMTHDLDFGALLHATKALGPSVIQIRAENILPPAMGEIVLETLSALAQQLENGALVSIDPRKRRIKLLPLGLQESKTPFP